jgi:hypothetical protein
MDRLSVGMVILEMLVGTDLMITATLKELQDKLLQDCQGYFDKATGSLLRYLILDDDWFDIETYIEHFIGGERDVVTGCILKFQAALLEDGDLQKWQKSGKAFLQKHPEASYDRFRIREGDIKQNIDWDTLANDPKYHISHE